MTEKSIIGIAQHSKTPGITRDDSQMRMIMTVVLAAMFCCTRGT
ncbi:hypothetical protein N8590_03330 [bacterium]|nr:hypothetical protein [bacterium]MDA7527999.1 hypothetical protein [bacterium]